MEFVLFTDNTLHTVTPQGKYTHGVSVDNATRDATDLRLIVNADDFGLTEGVNRAVRELAIAGCITSTSLMANGGAYGHAVAIAHQLPSLAIGCHIVLVDGRPIAPPETIPSLVDRNGNFRSSLLAFCVAVVLGRVQKTDIEREAAAQIQKLQASGIQVTHVDTHKHTHLLPAVASAVFTAATACGVRAVRNPVEPAAIAQLSAAPLLRRLQLGALRTLAGNFARRAAQAGLRTTDGIVGVAATGSLNKPSLRTTLHALPAAGGTWELVCHPGYDDPDLKKAGTRLTDSREIEREILCEIIGEAHYRLATFRDL